MSDDDGALVPYVPEAEIVDDAPAGFVRVLVLRNVFTLDRFERRIPEGQTLAEIVRGLGLPGWQSALVAIDGEAIPHRIGSTDWWALVRPKAGHVVTVRAIPRGGNENKGWIQVAAGVVLIAIGIILIATSPTTAGLGAVIGVGLITMGVGLAASGALTLIFPPPGPQKLKSGSGNDAPVFSLTGTRNIADPHGAITRPFGRHKIFLERSAR
jgi:sulfur carrier protein ThiS